MTWLLKELQFLKVFPTVTSGMIVKKSCSLKSITKTVKSDMIVKRVAVLKVFPTGTCTFTLVSVFQTVKELIFKTIYSCKNIIERGRHLRHLVQPH